MAVPAHLGQEAEDHYAFGFLAVDRECEGAKYHSPTPLIINNVVCDPEQGFMKIGFAERYFGVMHTAWLCSTCADNVALYLQLMKKHEGETSWPMRREFGNQVRTVGDQAWTRYLMWKRNEERCSG